jgi:hypothetical protein
MMRVFQQSYHIPGTLSADISIKFTVPFDCSLVHVSAVASNDSDATLKLGTSADDDAYLVAATIGDSGTPAEKDRADFVGTQYPHIADGTIFVATLDHDGSSGTAAQNVTIVLTFTQG